MGLLTKFKGKAKQYYKEKSIELKQRAAVEKDIRKKERVAYLNALRDERVKAAKVRARQTVKDMNNPNRSKSNFSNDFTNALLGSNEKKKKMNNLNNLI